MEEYEVTLTAGGEFSVHYSFKKEELINFINDIVYNYNLSNFKLEIKKT